MALAHRESEVALPPRDARGRFVQADPWRQISGVDRVRLQVITASAMALAISVLVLALVLMTPIAVR